jgi:hypothetical protein
LVLPPFWNFFTIMGLVHPEKLVMAMGKDDGTLPLPSGEKRATRRSMLPWLVALIVGVVLVQTILGWCYPGQPSLAPRNWIIPVDQGTAKLEVQAADSQSPTLEPRETTTTSTAAPTRTVLKTFEIAPPVLMPDGPADSDGSTRDGKDYSPELCTVLLMRHDFAWSYGAPYIGKPRCILPEAVALSFNNIVHLSRQLHAT